MLHYLYLDYGGRAQYRRELRYSLISLRQELGAGSDAGIAVYTDAPQLYANWPVEVVDIAAQTQAWSGNGLYHHRIKPANLTLELRATIALLGRSLAQLLFCIGLPFLQFFGRWKKALVLHGLPLHHVIVRDNRNAARRQHLIPTCVIEMVMAVDGILDWFIGEPLNFAD